MTQNLWANALLFMGYNDKYLDLFIRYIKIINN